MVCMRFARGRGAAVVRRPRILKGAAVAALALLCLRSSVASFTAPQPFGRVARAPGVARAHVPPLKQYAPVPGGRIETLEEMRRRRMSDGTAALSHEDLVKDHGDKWEDVDAVLEGLQAVSAETAARARFTALKFKDPNFLARTEKDDLQSEEERADSWAVTVGLKTDGLLGWMSTPLSFLGGAESQSLSDVQTFEVLSVDGEWVEFTIKCGDGKMLHEKSLFSKDDKYGYVYSGEDKFADWY
jgi:hypothetical protein